MKTLSCTRLCLVLCSGVLLYYLYRYRVTSDNNNISVEKPIVEASKNALRPNSERYDKFNVVVVVVACGDKLQETLTMIKSALMFTKVHVNFIVITEEKLIESFSEKLSQWRAFTNNSFSFKVLPLRFPVENSQEWRKLFKPCAAQRLFLPSVLKNTDSILYVDTDILFLTPVETIWEHFNQMNASQMAALAHEHEDANVGWYNRFARHPYYGKLGVNSGVMLMNLTRMREFQWVEYVVPIYKKYKLKITWGDQDIINIIFHFHSDKLYIYSCRYNFRPDHCMYMSVCKDAEKEGVAVIHGSRGFFHSEKQPAFKAIYRAFEEFVLGGDVHREFYQPLEVYLDATSDSNCGHIKDAYLKNVKRYIDVNT